MNNEKYIEIQIPEQLFDKLSDLAKEYSIDTGTLTAVAVKKLLADIEFVRSLRSGKIKQL